jgi:hypothetical protein
MTDHKGESVGTFETNQNERISTDGRPRQESVRLPTSFDSNLKPDIVLINESTKDIIIGELTCPMEAPGMKRILRNTTTWRTESQIKDSQSTSSLLKLAAEAWLESQCANSSLHWNFRRRLLKKLSLIAQSLH